MTAQQSLEDVLELAKRSGSLDACLRGLAEKLNTGFPVDRIIVGLVHPDGQRLVLVGVWGSTPTQFRIGATVRLTATVFHHLEDEGEPRVSGSEIRVEDMPLVEQVLWLEGMRSTASLPLRRQDGSTVGILLFSSESENVMSRHLLLFETIGLLFEDTLVRLGQAQLQDQLEAESLSAD
jgi:hypothetical protein